MQVEDCFMLGFILRPHGIKGELKAVFDVDDISQYKKKESVYVLQGKKLIPFSIEYIRIQSQRDVILKLREIRTRDEAETVAKCELYLPEDQLPELNDYQFYFHEIKGFVVQDEVLGTLGKVNKALEMPAQDLISMDYEGREVLIPITDDFVLKVDRENKIVFTHLPDGHLDVY